jgi:hypothetical protein
MSMSKGGSVPPASVELGNNKSGGERQDRRRHREARNAVCSRRRTWRPNFQECLARLSPGQKAGFEREIGLGGFEHLAVPSSPSLSGQIAFVDKANAKKADESGFPDEGKNFPDRPI